MTTTTETFDEAALAALPPVSGFVEASRKQAFEEYRTLPIPSQETEEWRYTDLSAFDLSFVPHTPGHGAGGAPAQDDAMGATMLQHNSSIVLTTSGQDLAAQGVILCDLDEAATEHADLVEPHLHRLVPTDRTKFTALHGAFRTGGTFLYVPDDVAVALPLQTLTWLDADGAAVFPHTLIVTGAHAEVTFIDRYSSPDLNRAFSDAVTEIVVGDGAHV